MLQLSDFNYTLPKERIAHAPAEPRDSSKLLVLDRQTGTITHSHYHDLADFLQPGDLLVRNNTKVIPARIFGQKTSGGHVEILLTKRDRIEPHDEVWECLTKPGLKVGQQLTFTDPETKQLSPLHAECVSIQHYSRLIRFNMMGSELFSELEKIGHTPLPPYIHWQGDDEQALRQLYQTTYAKHQGSAAAPTAGLHFTPELDAKLTAKGIEIAEVTLHVGLGTFLRVKDVDVTQHHMHQEAFELRPETATQLNQAKQAGRRIIAIGTTTTRVLETCANDQGLLTAQSGETGIYIYPPYRFKCIDGLITNFHEPQSTLLMLVSAFVTAPNTSHTFHSFSETTVGRAYTAAISEHYRMLSFGDGMLIV